MAKSLNEKKIEYQNKLYIGAIVAILLKVFFTYSQLVNKWMPQMIHQMLVMTFLFLLGYKIIIEQTYSKKVLYISIISGLVVLISGLRAGYTFPIFSFIAIVAAQNVDFKRVVKVMYRMKAVYIAINVFAYIILYQIRPDMISFSYRGGVENPEPRHYFFLSHANVFSMMLAWTILEYMYANFEKLDKKKVVMLWLINFIFYQFTDSNTGIIIVSLVSILWAGNKYGKRKIIMKAISFAARYLFLICAIVFPVLATLLPKLSGSARELWMEINAIFTGRILYGAYAYDTWGISLLGKQLPLGQNIYWQGFWFETAACDNIYIWMFVCYGYLQVLITAVAFVIIGKKTSMEDKIFFIAYAVHGIMEAYIPYTFFCFPLMLLGKYLFMKGTKSNEGKNQVA